MQIRRWYFKRTFFFTLCKRKNETCIQLSLLSAPQSLLVKALVRLQTWLLARCKQDGALQKLETLQSRYALLSFLLPRAKTHSGLEQSYRERVSWDLIFDHYSCCFRVTSSSLTETRLPLHKKCWYKKTFLKLNFYLRRPNFVLQPRTPPTPGRSVCCCNL